MSNFSVEISINNDDTVISLDTDEMNICVYQETGNGKTRVLDITCDKPGGEVVGTLLTKVEFVGADDDLANLVKLEGAPVSKAMEIYTNKFGGQHE